MENKLICLDTSVLIDYFRKTKKENSFLFELTEKYDTFAVSTVTEFEIYAGCTEAQKTFWDNFFSNLVILPFDRNSSQLAAKLFQKLKRKNQLIGVPDLLIGATALANELPLATLNENHFSRIDQLNLITKNN